MKNNTWYIDDVKGTVDEEKNTCKRTNTVKHEDEKRCFNGYAEKKNSKKYSQEE